MNYRKAHASIFKYDDQGKEICSSLPSKEDRWLFLGKGIVEPSQTAALKPGGGWLKENHRQQLTAPYSYLRSGE